jgi:transcription factor TFIIIB component B''
MSAAERQPYVDRREVAAADYHKAVNAFKAKFDTRPRKPMTGYLRYAKERLQAMRAQRPGLQMSEYVRHVAGEWRALAQADKAKFTQQARADQDKYNKLMEEWKAKHSKTEQLVGRMAHSAIRRSRGTPQAPKRTAAA